MCGAVSPMSVRSLMPQYSTSQSPQWDNIWRSRHSITSLSERCESPQDSALGAFRRLPSQALQEVELPSYLSPMACSLHRGPGAAQCTSKLTAKTREPFGSLSNSELAPYPLTDICGESEPHKLGDNYQSMTPETDQDHQEDFQYHHLEPRIRENSQPLY